MSTLSFQFPDSPFDLTPAQLSELVSTVHPGTVVTAFEVINASQFGDGMVSTADRALLKLQYAGEVADTLPQQVMLKLQRDIGAFIKSIYINETRFYLKLGHEAGVEMPQVIGGGYDSDTGNYGLLLEDITLRGASFPNVTHNTGVAHVAAVIDQLAMLHARYWDSPRFATDLAWVESHVQGPVSELLSGSIPVVAKHELDSASFKRDLVAQIGTTLPDMIKGTAALQQHQSRLPQTLLHGDTHLGNTYALPGERAGLIDWQLCVRGYCMHDVSYIITTGLPVAERRQHERALIQRYREALLAHGVSQPPSQEQLWEEHRRAMLWGFYVGWLGVSPVNYGWEILATNLLRVATAYVDLETARLIDEIL